MKKKHRFHMKFSPEPTECTSRPNISSSSTESPSQRCLHRWWLHSLVMGGWIETQSVWPTFALGFHAVHRRTWGMSHNQTQWLLLNRSAVLSLAHLEPSCLKTAPAIHSCSAPADNCRTIATYCFPATAGHTYSLRDVQFELRGVKTTFLHNGALLGWGGPGCHVGGTCYV